MAVVLDTHTVIWYLLESPRLSQAALHEIEETVNRGEALYLASISLVEVIYLVEKGRLPEAALERLNAALLEPDSAFELAVLDFATAGTVRQIPRELLPDMPDRIIAATALARNLPLITRDRGIRAAGLNTIW